MPRRLAQGLVVFVFLGTAAIAPGAAQTPPVADQRPVPTGVEEHARARLFVVPLRIETTSTARPGECMEMRLVDLTVVVRGKLMKGKAYQQAIDSGHVALDRRRDPTLHALVLDTSGSMTDDLPQAKHAASAYVRQLSPERDRALVAGFDDVVTLWQGVTFDHAKLLRGIDDVRVGGQTSLFDALVHVMRELDGYRERPVLVVLSDGDDNASFYDELDVIAELKTRPDLAIFTIGVGLQGSETRALLRRLAASTAGRFFDIRDASKLDVVFEEIRDVLGLEAVLSVVDPKPEKEGGSVEVRSFNADCSVRVLATADDAVTGGRTREPIVPPLPDLPHSYAASLSAAFRKTFARADRKEVEAACSPDGIARELRGDAGEPAWVFHVEPSSIRGCAPDITLDQGYLYVPGAPDQMARNLKMRMAVRAFEIPVTARPVLPRTPAEAIDAVFTASTAATQPGAIDPALVGPRHAQPFSGHPSLVHGTTFLEMRPRIARGMFLQSGYQQWVLGRLQETADRGLSILEGRYRRQFKGYSDAAVKLATRHSDEGQRILERAASPSEIDLQPLLAAWLGDIPAHDLFVRWERLRIDRLLGATAAAGDTEEFLDGWNRLAQILGAPSHARILGLLSPVYDERCDCVGFYRIVLPRPSLLRPRLYLERPAENRIPLDLVPPHPLGYRLTDELARTRPGMMQHLESRGYRGIDVSYELLGPAIGHVPFGAFSQTRVRVTLSDGIGSLEIVGDLRIGGAAPAGGSAVPPAAALHPWSLSRLRLEVKDDPRLRELARDARRNLMDEQPDGGHP